MSRNMAEQLSSYQQLTNNDSVNPVMEAANGDVVVAITDNNGGAVSF